MVGSALGSPHLLPGLPPTCTGRNAAHAPLSHGAVVDVSSIALCHDASLSSLQASLSETVDMSGKQKQSRFKVCQLYGGDSSCIVNPFFHLHDYIQTWHRCCGHKAAASNVFLDRAYQHPHNKTSWTKVSNKALQLTCMFPIRKAKRSKPTMMIQMVKMISHI